MITPLDIYWITRLDSIINTTIPFFVISLITLLLSIVLYITGNIYDKRHDFCKKAAEKRLIAGRSIFPFALISTIVFSLIVVFVPCTKEAVAIYAIPKIANNQDVQQIPANFAKLINSKLQEWMMDVEIIEGAALKGVK